LELLDYDGEKDNPGSACCDVCDKEENAAEANNYLIKTGKLIKLRNFFWKNKIKA
jgi:hypothetical protein